ncbi:SPT2 chromatin protein [Raphanus sativus]|uniref:Uncharacterized protein LOC108841418 n=1 Tax=Raphanus sativus TaxID=3726 RepID=A0A6J0MAV7_RAPSA|nr:uncharacterized protein LOC108841418 [Raphanus sativus]XP_056859755.1 uncharacterized protein LOC130508327 [Raphanus sativus]KAJ4914097.1 SPT2 chromatin protein [Raphanus sativus]KAJ4914104.1 SPT2 chromatin protein [Raphanus sativus]
MSSNYLTELKRRSEAEFLEFRQRIKESIRNKTQNGNDLLAPTSEEDSMPSKRQKLHEFGSFFGPSQPGIASRVLQESKPLLKDELLAAKALDSIQINKSTPSPTSVSEANELKRKAKQLKESRDYSFLFSDDAELPVSIKEPPSSLVPNSRASSRGSHSSRPRSSTKGQPQTKLGSKLRPQRPAAPARISVPMDHSKKLTQKPSSSSKPLTSDPKEQRKVSNETKRSSQVVPRKQALPPSKQREVSKPPLKQAHQLKKKLSEEDEEALRMIREMCKTDRFARRDLDDYDDRCMEATLEDIIKEEKRSEKLAKKEDAEQLRLIEEDEKRERLMRKEKRQKMNH